MHANVEDHGPGQHGERDDRGEAVLHDLQLLQIPCVDLAAWRVACETSKCEYHLSLR